MFHKWSIFKATDFQRSTDDFANPRKPIIVMEMKYYKLKLSIEELVNLTYFENISMGK